LPTFDPGTPSALTLRRGDDLRDEHERHQELPPVPATRGFESMDSAPNDQAREVLREEGLAPQGGEAAPPDRLIHDLTHPDPPPLTQAGRETVEHDPGRPERVYAPASARVPKEPAPGDERLLHGNDRGGQHRWPAPARLAAEAIAWARGRLRGGGR
jgi:hypothetical protein